MGYWDDRDDLLWTIEYDYYYANYYRGFLAVNIENAISDLGYGDIPGAVGWICTCLTNIKAITQELIGRQGAMNPKYHVVYFLEHYTIATLDWKTICEAWASDNFEGRFWTIAMIDRMRQLIWDEPFFIAWAARPEEQEII